MSTLDSMLERNKAMAARHSDAGTLMPSLPAAMPHVRATIIGCADIRVDPVGVFNLHPGESVVPRNIGGRLLEELRMLGRVGQVVGGAPGGGEFHLIVLHHTDCGIRRLAGDPAMLAHYFQIPESEVEKKARTDPHKSVAIDVAALRAMPALPPHGSSQASSTMS